MTMHSGTPRKMKVCIHKTSIGRYVVVLSSMKGISHFTLRTWGAIECPPYQPSEAAAAMADIQEYVREVAAALGCEADTRFPEQKGA